MTVAELPDAPAEVQVESGPQHGTLLVMWLPVTVTERSCTAAITGYSVYVDGRRVKDLQSPTGTSCRRVASHSVCVCVVGSGQSPWTVHSPLRPRVASLYTVR